jgi:Zn finger protein HypA/HybF involved in hydrogenase expression
MWLVCSRRCGSNLFRALFAEVEIDAHGAYLSHRITEPSYLCLNCGAPAIELGAVAAEMDAEAAAETAPQALEVLCPICETRVEILPGESCPNCGADLEVSPG